MASLPPMVAGYWPYILAAVSLSFIWLGKLFALVMDWLGFRNQTLDLKKTKLEIKEIEEKRLGRIQAASFSDVTQYDPNVQNIIEAAQRERYIRARSLSPSKEAQEEYERNHRLETFIFHFVIYLIALAVAALGLWLGKRSLH